MELMSGLIFVTSLVIVTAASLGIILKLLLPHREDREGCVRVCMVLGSGGHTTEMVALARALDRRIYTPRSYIIADTDHLSRLKVEQEECGDADDVDLITIPRSREVGQSYITSIPTTLYALLRSVLPIIQLQPQLLLVNGPGTCLPLVVIARLLSLSGISRCQIVFVESVCRVTSLSLTGTVLQYIADEALVQWPDLAGKYPRTKYIGKFL